MLQGAYNTSQLGMIMAGAAIASIPVLIFYAIFQKQIIKSIMLTGLKG